MMIFRSRAAGTLAAAAALSLTATPAMAHGWHHHDDGVDAGDVLAGLLIVGGIAAIALAASHSSQQHQVQTDQDYRDYPSQPDDNTYRPEPNRLDTYREALPPNDDYRSHPGYARPAVSADGAVDACVGAIENGQRGVESIDSANREGSGWRIAGRDRAGHDFTCAVDGQGSIRGVVGA
jgi:hypothetical protein